MRTLFAQKKPQQNAVGRKDTLTFFFHPDYTVGFGIAPKSAYARGLVGTWPHHRRWGIAPRPEDSNINF